MDCLRTPLLTLTFIWLSGTCFPHFLHSFVSLLWFIIFLQFPFNFVLVNFLNWIPGNKIRQHDFSYCLVNPYNLLIHTKGIEFTPVRIFTYCWFRYCYYRRYLTTGDPFWNAERVPLLCHHLSCISFLYLSSANRYCLLSENTMNVFPVFSCTPHPQGCIPCLNSQLHCSKS